MYELSETFKNIDWSAHTPSERGGLENYVAVREVASVFDNRTFTARVVIMVDPFTGKPFSIMLALGGYEDPESKKVYLTTSKDTDNDSFSGAFCEQILIDFAKKTLEEWNALLRINFKIAGIN